MKNTKLHLLLSTLVLAFVATLVGHAADPVAPRPTAAGALTSDEKKQVAKARADAVKANPDLTAEQKEITDEQKKLSEHQKAFKQKVDDAVAKADPAAAALIAKSGTKMAPKAEPSGAKKTAVEKKSKNSAPASKTEKVDPAATPSTTN